MFIYKRKINFYDCDPAGILFFGRIYEVCHSAYEAMIESFNLNIDYWNNGDFVVPIIHSEASYHKPIKYGETIVVELEVSMIKYSSFELQYLCKNAAGEKCIKVSTVHVFIDKKEWSKKELRKDVKDGLFKHLSGTTV